MNRVQRASALVGGATCIVIAGSVLGSQSACQLRESCEADTEPPPDVPAPTGDLLDANTWESSPILADWLPFPGSRTQYFDLRLLGHARTIRNIFSYLSPDPNWADAGSNFTSSSGNLTEVSVLYPIYEGPPIDGGLHPGDTLDTIAVSNATCAGYYLRLVVEAEPLDGGSGTLPPGTVATP